jgi:hypothetical protein
MLCVSLPRQGGGPWLLRKQGSNYDSHSSMEAANALATHTIPMND